MSGITVEPPDEAAELFNRADPHCELCEGRGHLGPRPIGGLVPCPCTGRKMAWPRTVWGTTVHKTSPESAEAAWFVPSRSQEGAFWKVTHGRVGGGAHGPFGLACTCPAGRAHEEREGTPYQTGPRVCWHAGAVLKAENAENAYPPRAPLHPGLRAN